MDYSMYLYKPFDKKELDRLRLIPELSDFPDKILNFLIIMWDFGNTEFRRLYPDYFSRKREAAIAAGIKTGSDGKFDEETEEILTGQNDDFNTGCVKYLLGFGIPDYPALIAQRELQAKELEAAFKETDPKERKVIRENIDKSTERICEYEAKIFGGMETENVRKALYKHMESEKLRLRPEHVAGDTKKGKLKIKSQY